MSVNLSAYKNVQDVGPRFVDNKATEAEQIKNEFIAQVTSLEIKGLSKDCANYQGRQYIVYIKSFNMLDSAAYAFHIGAMGTQLLILAHLFERSENKRNVERLKGGAGVIGNTLKGFVIGQRSIYDEIDFLKNIGKVVTGSGIQPLADATCQESALTFAALLRALDKAMEFTKDDFDIKIFPETPNTNPKPLRPDDELDITIL
jgi:hypothetical protein